MHCDSCNLEIPLGVRYCPYCGVEVGEPETSPPEKPRTEESGRKDAEPVSASDEVKSKIKQAYYIEKNLELAMEYINEFYSQFGNDEEVARFQQKILKKMGGGEKSPVPEEGEQPSGQHPPEPPAAPQSPQPEEDVVPLEDFAEQSDDEIFDLGRDIEESESGREESVEAIPPEKEKERPEPAFEEEVALYDLDDDRVEILTDEPEEAEGLSLADDEQDEVLDLSAEDVLELGEDMLSPEEEHEAGGEKELSLMEDELPKRKSQPVAREEESAQQEIDITEPEVRTPGREAQLVEDEELFAGEGDVDLVSDLEVVDSSEDIASGVPLPEDAGVSIRDDDAAATMVENEQEPLVKDESRLTAEDERQPMVGDEPQPLISMSESPPSRDLGDLLAGLKKKAGIFENKRVMIGAAAGLVVLVLLIFIFSSKNDPPEPAPSENQISTARRTQPDRRRTAPAKTSTQKSPGEKESGAGTTRDAGDLKIQEHIKRAREFFEKGDLANAERTLAQARNIKTTPEIENLTREIENQKKAKALLKEVEVKEDMQTVSPEERAYQRAMASATVARLESFLQKYPTSMYGDSIRLKLVEVRKTERRQWEGKLKQDVQVFRKIYLRSSPAALSPEEVQALIPQARAKSYRYRSHTVDGAEILVDYATGLMWHPWERAIDFKKAQWWAARRHAGFYNWRMPTTEEAAALVNGGTGYFKNLAASRGEIWTSDRDDRNQKNIWVLSLGKSLFKSVDPYQYKHLWSVRNIK